GIRDRSPAPGATRVPPGGGPGGGSGAGAGAAGAGAAGDGTGAAGDAWAAAGGSGAPVCGSSTSRRRAAWRPSSATTSGGSQVPSPGGSPRRSSTAGRSPGSLARQRSTSSRTGPVSPSRSAGSDATRNSWAWTPPSPPPNGGRPVAAYASTAPREKTSDAGGSGSPRTCSGDM